MVGPTSRRALLQAFTVTPIAVPLIAPPWTKALAAVHRRYDDAPATLQRTKQGRSISRFRYHNAERSCLLLEAGFFSDPRFVRQTLHQAGSIAQQALCAYLLDIGFADPWNARQIRQDIAKALAYANATGLGHHCPDMARLASVLSPYWKWGYHYDSWEEQPDRDGFTPATIIPLVRALVDRVHDVTGHRAPSGCRRVQREARS
ncbi:hypothetical protein [Novosphingobium sp.]|uniref:hypothetical protein n=1 Tax=Novosphingobium sp. TaxID=1874826 RepID=UPI00352B5F58